MKLFTSVVIAVILMGFNVGIQVQPVNAQKVSKAEVVRNASSNLIEGLLDSLDISYTKLKDGAYHFKVAGYKVVLFNKGVDIQLFAGFTGKKVTLKSINEWNRGKRFSRAYLDQEGDAVLEADLDFEGGVTGETLLRFIALFVRSVDSFSTHIS